LQGLLVGKTLGDCQVILAKNIGWEIFWQLLGILFANISKMNHLAEVR
jgi:hypothetical protein